MLVKLLGEQPTVSQHCVCVCVCERERERERESEEIGRMSEERSLLAD
jgi:hypothetical protein